MSIIPPPINIVGDEVPCTRCGYSLRGLAIVGKCPECGWPVEASLNGNLLRYASPDYLEKLQRGIVIVLSSVIAQLVLGLLMMVVVFAGIAMMAAAGGPGGAPPGAFPGAAGAVMTWVVVLGTMLGTLISLASAFGYWMLTTPDAAASTSEQTVTARKLVRASVVASFVIGLASSALQVLEPALATGNPGPTPIPMLLQLLEALFSLLATAATAVHFFAMMRYVRWLAGRVPDAGMVQQTRLYIWLLPLLTIVGMMCFGLGPLVAMVLYLVMLWNLRKQIVACHRLALTIGT